MLKQCLENIGEGLLHACISSNILLRPFSTSSVSSLFILDRCHEIISSTLVLRKQINTLRYGRKVENSLKALSIE